MSTLSPQTEIWEIYPEDGEENQIINYNVPNEELLVSNFGIYKVHSDFCQK